MCFQNHRNHPEPKHFEKGLGVASHAVLPGADFESRLDSAHLPRCLAAAAVFGAHALRFPAEPQRLDRETMDIMDPVDEILGVIQV